MTVLQSVRKITDNEFYFVAGYLRDSCTASGTSTIPYVDPVIGKMDTLGGILSMQRYPLNALTCGNTALDLEVLQDMGAVAWGRDNTFFALRVDPMGTPVWSKQFNHSGCINFVRELPSGDLLAGITMDTAGIAVARLDAGGNILWCKSYIRPKGMVRDCLIESDDSFILTGYTDVIATPSVFQLPPGYDPKLFLMKLNGAGDVQWCRGYENGPGWYAEIGSQIVQAQDGNYVVLANSGIPNYKLEDQPFLMKTDQNGDTLWTRSMGMNGYRYLTVDLIASSDGGYYYDGGAYGNFHPGSGATFLFKTDSLGHLPCHERSHLVEVSDLFPVDSSFTLSSTDGAIAWPTAVPDTIPGFTIMDDGCTFFTGLAPMRRQPRNMSVRPNPNTGRFTMAFPDPLMAESYYSVYDAMGRLLYQRPLPTGATAEEIDLSRFGKGTYVIKLTDPDGVCFERVVLE